MEQIEMPVEDERIRNAMHGGCTGAGATEGRRDSSSKEGGGGWYLEAAGNELGLICHELAVQAVDHTHLQQPFPVLNTIAKAQISERAA